MSAHSHDHRDHHHGHHHDHGGHDHAPKNFDRAFAIGIGLNMAFVVGEALAGWAAHSLSLLADAGHNFGDVLSLLLAWAAAWLTRKQPSKHRTYGFGRTSILASLINALVLLIATGAIAWEAMGRLFSPEAVNTQTVFWVALAGIFVNGATALLFMRGGKDDINIRGAFMHMAADALVSLGVVFAAIVIAKTGWVWIDPAVGLAIAAVIALGTYGLLRDSIDLALDAVPPHIDRHAVEDYLKSQSGVSAVHDLHIWPLSTTSVALTAHLVRPDAQTDDDWLHRIGEELHDKFDIDHATLQVENGRGQRACKLSPDEVV